MNFFRRMLSKRKSKSSANCDAKRTLSQVEIELTKKSQFLEQKVNDELQNAKEHGTINKKSKFIKI